MFCLANLTQAAPDLLWNVTIALALQLYFVWGKGEWGFLAHLIHFTHPSIIFLFWSNDREKGKNIYSKTCFIFQHERASKLVKIKQTRPKMVSRLLICLCFHFHKSLFAVLVRALGSTSYKHASRNPRL